jgi:hypothetical protein
MLNTLTGEGGLGIKCVVSCQIQSSLLHERRVEVGTRVVPSIFGRKEGHQIRERYDERSVQLMG